MILRRIFLTALLSLVIQVYAACDSHSPAFQLPALHPSDRIIKAAHSKIYRAIHDSYAHLDSNITSFSVEVTASDTTLFTIHHTAADLSPFRPGATKVTDTSRYRIASVTKAFTVLAIIQQHIAGTLNLDDPVNKYIPSLGEKGSALIPWKDISIRSLASQLSGIPRDIALQDFSTRIDDPSRYGLPPISHEGLLTCGEFSHNKVPCTESDLLGYLDKKEPLFPPKQQSTYSNMNYDLLGLVVENVTGMSYEDYVEEKILKELNLTSTSFERPADEVSVLPNGASDFWNVDLGIQKATGGLYSSSGDLASFIRYVLTHYNGLTPALNWLSPLSYSTGLNSFYGMPWEILRTDSILAHTTRPVTFVTKGGSLPAYKTLISMVPEYGFGFTVLTAGDEHLSQRISSIIGEVMVKAAEAVALRQTRDAHVGTFVAAKGKYLDSSIQLAHSKERGLYVESWTSNSTNALLGFLDLIKVSGSGMPDVRVQLVPTLLYKDELKKKGEIWRMIPVSEDHEDDEESEDGTQESGMYELFDELCLTDIDFASYGGVPLNEVVFWNEDASGTFGSVELSGYRIRLERKQGKHDRLDDTASDEWRNLRPDDSQQAMYLTDGLGNVFGEDW